MNADDRGGGRLAHLILACTVALAVAGGFAYAAQEKPRVALVVGVGKYLHIPELPNTINDARAVAAALKGAGFDVDLVADPDKPTLDAAIRRFGERATGADAALFYYAGHALELEGRNWIVPASADIHSARDLPYESSDIDTLMAQLEGAARFTIVVLDACRENPFRNRLSNGRGLQIAPGLAEVRAATGALIEYATAPGMVAADGDGEHSPFTAALLHHIETPGLEVHQLFGAVRREVRGATDNKQIPWESSAMEGEFTSISPHSKPAPAPAESGESADILFWKSIAESRDPADFKAYLTQFPKGVYAGLAANRMRQYEQISTPQPEPTRKAEADAALSDDDLRQRLVAAAPSLSDFAKFNVRLYLELAEHRALFLSPKRVETYRVGPYSSPLVAEEAGAERCQLHFAAPCFLLSVDRKPTDPAEAGERKMARVAYAGRFDPEQVPGLTPEQRAGDDLRSYASKRGPRPSLCTIGAGPLEITEAADEPTAEREALDACNDDPDRNGQDGPCLLYAVGDNVVLPQRRQDPTDAAPVTRIESAANPLLPPATLKTMMADYMRADEPKALAIDLAGQHYFHSWGSRWAGSRKQHEILALEGCQHTFGSPCVLAATGTELHTSNLAAAPKRDMPQARFPPANVPFVSADKADDLADYASLPEPKAMAIRAVWTRYSIVSGAASAAEAEREALAKCREADPTIKYPCFVYASGMHVVLRERRAEPKR